MKFIWTKVLIGFAVVGIAVGVYAADLEKGAVAYEQGDYATALREFRPLAEKGVILAQILVGDMYHDGEGVTKDYKEAAKWYRLAAEQDHGRAQYMLGVMFKDGRGVDQDDKEAVKWIYLAASHGDRQAQYAMALLYSYGRGVKQDKVKAEMWATITEGFGFPLSTDVTEYFEENLTAAERIQAVQLAVECVKKSYQGC